MKKFLVWIILAATIEILLLGCEKESFSLPTVETGELTQIDLNSAQCRVIVTDEGNNPVNSLGLCYSTTNIDPTIADLKQSTTNETVSLTGLSSGTYYYVRAYATSKTGTGYGKTKRFSTKFETTTDREGNVYRFTKIGTQTWMADNLRTTIFNDGSPIPNKTEDRDWSRESGTTSPAYCWYNNDQSHKATYGALYNGHAALDPRLCPTGWHVPSNDEFQTLFWLLGSNLTGIKMKAFGPESGWQDPNTGADNSSNFSALPGGFRGDSTDGNNTFNNLHIETHFWTSTDTGFGVLAMSLFYDKPYIRDNVLYNKAYGFSVRCIRNL